MAIPKFATSRLDRERSVAFFKFTWARFLEDRCLQTAGALAFTTLFALVPLSTATLGILSAFPVFEEWRVILRGWIFENFVPAAGDVVQGYLTEFSANASKATTIGVLVLVFSAISLMMSIEDAFNRIWRVNVNRGPASRFVIYWTALSLGPMLLIGAFAISSYLFALPFIDAAATQFSIKARILAVLPFLIVWSALITAYMVIPNRRVRLRDAAVGGLIAVVLFESAKRAFASYATGMASYEQVYGALSIVPIFFLWVYLSWIIVLLGASLTASVSSFDYRHSDKCITPDQELAGLLRVIVEFAAAHRDGRGMHSAELLEREPCLTDDLLQRYLGDLSRLGVIRRTEMGEWILSRDLAGISLLDLYREGNYRLPVGNQRVPGEILVDCGAGPLQNLATNLRERLDISLASLIQSPPSADGNPPSIRPGTST